MPNGTPMFNCTH